MAINAEFPIQILIQVRRVFFILEQSDRKKWRLSRVRFVNLLHLIQAMHQVKQVSVFQLNYDSKSAGEIYTSTSLICFYIALR